MSCYHFFVAAAPDAPREIPPMQLNSFIQFNIFFAFSFVRKRRINKVVFYIRFL